MTDYATPNATDFLLGGGGASAKFDHPGDTVTGTITHSEVTAQTDIQSGQPLKWDDGSTRMQLVVSLQTDQRDPSNPDDDGVRKVYVKGSKKVGSKSLHDAVASAVRNAGAKGLEPGGTLTVTHTGTEPAKTRGFNDRKLYEATYAAPDKAAQTGGFLGTGEVQQAQQPAANSGWDVPAQPQQPTSGTPAAPQQQGMTPEQMQAFNAWQSQQQGQQPGAPF